ncbi:MAG: helix-turn-helix transcriptional regulator, partial [Candidatus Brocadiae bacterium]|nr:helix-turn-helix transcriptional regulator [Candidatus Brocadiia bacterium]
IERVTCDPMPDETIRRCRAPRFSQARAAERMEVPLDTYCAWEDGTAPVPLDMRGPLRDLLGLPPGTWPGEALSLWTPIDPASTKPPMLIAWPGGPAGQDIRSARHARRWTQSELARHLDISHKTVSNWERGRSGVPKRHHALLCRLLGLDSPDLKPHNKDAA